MSNLATSWSDVDRTLTYARSPILIEGIPGTGKSWAAKKLGLTHPKTGKKRLVYVLQCTEETPAIIAQGYERVVGGDMIYGPGPIPRSWGWDDVACQTGVLNPDSVGRLVIEEIDKASGDLLQILLCAGDDPRIAQMLLPTGLIITPPSNGDGGYQVVATSNSPISSLPDALRDRFEGLVLHINKPAPGAIKDLDSDVRKAATSSCVAKGEARIGIRQWRAFCELRKDTSDAKFAARIVFNKRADEVLSDLAIGAT